MTIKIRKPYEPRLRVSFTCEGESLTKQSMKMECDINSIMAKWQSTGQVQHVMASEGAFFDASSAPEYQEALNLVQEADASFMALPSSIRNRFSNSPAEFLSFIHNPDNLDEMIRLGLAEKNSPASPDPAPASPENPAPGADNPTP